MSEIGEKKFALPLKTGQTTQYGGYLDDGYYEKGLSKKYQVLSTGQYSGTTSITLNGKTCAHSNNCVKDLITKLVWSRYVPESVGPSSDGKLPWTTNANGEGVFAYVAAANVAKLGGYDDWRLANSFELLTLIISEALASKADSTAFPSWPTNEYVYTSSTHAATTTKAHTIIFNTPYLLTNTKTEDHLFALVRGG